MIYWRRLSVLVYSFFCTITSCFGHFFFPFFSFSPPFPFGLFISHCRCRCIAAVVVVVVVVNIGNTRREIWSFCVTLVAATHTCTHAQATFYPLFFLLRFSSLFLSWDRVCMFDGWSAGECCALSRRTAANDDDDTDANEEQVEERVFCVGRNYCFKRTVINGRFLPSFPIYCYSNEKRREDKRCMQKHFRLKRERERKKDRKKKREKEEEELVLNDGHGCERCRWRVERKCLLRERE